jgi:hypothetical protein
MKYGGMKIKFMDYDQFLNESMNIKSTTKWLKKVVKGKYTINPDGTVDVEGDVICKSSEIDKFPVKFGNSIAATIRI